MSWTVHSVIWILLYAKGALCLRMKSLSVPDPVVVGQTIKLTCLFELEGDTLYSIKWYRNDVEFFRFVPRDNPPGQYFPMDGVHVDMLRSANNSVILQDINKTTSGKFKCEVSAEAPSFQTEFVKTELIVKNFDEISSSSRLMYSFLTVSGLLLATFLS